MPCSIVSNQRTYEIRDIEDWPRRHIVKTQIALRTVGHQPCYAMEKTTALPQRHKRKRENKKADDQNNDKLKHVRYDHSPQSSCTRVDEHYQTGDDHGKFKSTDADNTKVESDICNTERRRNKDAEDVDVQPQSHDRRDDGEQGVIIRRPLRETASQEFHR